MKALFRYDWEKSGQKLLILFGISTAVIAILYVLYYLFIGYSDLGGNDLLSYYTAIKRNPFGGLPLNLLVIFSACLSGKLIDDDRHSGWYNLCMAMPLSRSKYVREKYLFGLIFMAAAIVFTCIVHTVIITIKYPFLKGNTLTVLFYPILYYLRFYMIYGILTAVITFLTFCKNFGVGLLVPMIILIVIPMIFVIIISITENRMITDVFYGILNYIDNLQNTARGVIFGNIASVLTYVLSYFLSLLVVKRADI